MGLFDKEENFDREFYFISGRIFDIELPKEQQYLYKYFKTARQRSFVKYYLVYDNFKHFSEQTGYSLSDRMAFRLKKLLTALLTAHEKAKKEGDSSTIAKIESGKFTM